MTSNWQLVVLLVAIFTSQWMASRHFDQRIGDFDRRLTGKIDDQGNHLNGRIDDLRSFIEAKLETVRVEIADLKVRVKRIEDQLDRILKPTLK